MLIHKDKNYPQAVNSGDKFCDSFENSISRDVNLFAIAVYPCKPLYPRFY